MQSGTRPNRRRPNRYPGLHWSSILIHECTFPRKAIEFRKKAGVGLWAHTPAAELGALAERVGAKRLVATHFGNFDTTNPVVKECLGIHRPAEMVGPELMEEVQRIL